MVTVIMLWIFHGLILQAFPTVVCSALGVGGLCRDYNVRNIQKSSLTIFMYSYLGPDGGALGYSCFCYAGVFCFNVYSFLGTREETPRHMALHCAGEAERR